MSIVRLEDFEINNKGNLEISTRRHNLILKQSFPISKPCHYDLIGEETDIHQFLFTSIYNKEYPKSVIDEMMLNVYDI